MCFILFYISSIKHIKQASLYPFPTSDFKGFDVFDFKFHYLYDNISNFTHKTRHFSLTNLSTTSLGGLSSWLEAARWTMEKNVGR